MKEENQSGTTEHGAAAHADISLPGDRVFSLESYSNKSLHLGPGIAKKDNDLLALKCGSMRHKPPSTFFLDPLVELYSPAVGDDIVGVIVRRKGNEVSEQYYVVDFGKNVERRTAVLPVLAFKGATKRYRPNLHKGDLVYCRIRRVTPNGPIRLTCTSDNTGHEIWGPLKRTGSVYRASAKFIKRCLTPDSPERSMINQIGEKLPWEIALGINGRIWFYTGFEKSQNAIYGMFRDAELANGDADLIAKVIRKAFHEIAAAGQDIPLEDNTQYWVTRVV